MAVFPGVVNGISYDQYGGYTGVGFVARGGVYVTPEHVQNGNVVPGFRLGMIGQQWVMVNALGNVCPPRLVFKVSNDQTQTLGGLVGGQNGRSLRNTCQIKYSEGTSGPNWRAATFDRLQRWHFNGIAPSGSIGGQGVVCDFLHGTASQYSKFKPFVVSDSGGALADAVKDIFRALPTNPPGNEMGYRSTSFSSTGWGDWFDPKYATYMTLYGSYAPGRDFGGLPGPSTMGYLFEESDFISRTCGAGHTNEVGLAAADSNWCPHTGMLILWSNPVVTSQVSARDGQTYTWSDTINYSKKRIIDNLKAKYVTITALNNAWNTGGYYTSFDSAGGWGTGTGVADEDGLRNRAWFGAGSAQFFGHIEPAKNNVVDSTTWNANVKIDLDNLLKESVVAWIKPFHDMIRARDPGALISHCNNGATGNGGAPARTPVLEALAPYIDFVTGGNVYPTGNAPHTIEQGQACDALIYNKISKPILLSVYHPAGNHDSALYYLPNFTSTQTSTGQTHFTRLDLAFRHQFANGIFPFIGWQKWGLYDQVNEQLAWGLISYNDNPYDGRDYRVPQPDPWTPGRTAFTEDNAYTDLLGFGGTTSLQRSDLMVGANINILTALEANLATAANRTLTAAPMAVAATLQPVTTTVTAPFRLVASTLAFTRTLQPVTTTLGTAAGTFTDTFNRADSSSLGANWQEIAGDLRIINNRCFPLAGSTLCRARRTADQGSVNHYAQAKVFASSVPAGNTARAYVEIRGNATDLAGYRFGLHRLTNGSFDVTLQRLSTSGVGTTLTSAVGISYTSGSTIRLEGEGTTLTGKIGSTTVLGPFIDPTPILTGLRTGFSNTSGTNSTSDFEHDDFQSGTLGALPNTNMVASPLAYAAALLPVTTTRFGIRLAANTISYAAALVDLTLTRSAKRLAVDVLAYTATMEAAGTFKTVTGGDTGVFRIRVLRFVPGKTALLIVRATVPSGQEFFYADPAAVSLHPVTTAAEDTALRAGTIVEKRVSVTAPGTFAALQTLAEAEQAAFQAEVDASDVAGMSGLYGVGTRYSGTDWA